MRISSALVSALAVGLVFGAGPSGGFDGNSPSNSLSPLEAFRSGTLALKVGETEKAITSLQYAAENGHAAGAMEARAHVCGWRWCSA